MVQWILNNKEWLFSGLGVSLIIAIVTLFSNYFKSKKKDSVVHTDRKSVV